MLTTLKYHLANAKIRKKTDLKEYEAYITVVLTEAFAERLVYVNVHPKHFEYQVTDNVTLGDKVTIGRRLARTMPNAHRLMRSYHYKCNKTGKMRISNQLFKKKN